jgi:hypothetical protein
VPAHFEIDLPANTEVFLEMGVYDCATGKAGTLKVPLHPAGITTSSTSPAQPKTNWRGIKCTLQSRFGSSNSNGSEWMVEDPEVTRFSLVDGHLL